MFEPAPRIAPIAPECPMPIFVPTRLPFIRRTPGPALLFAAFLAVAGLLAAPACAGEAADATRTGLASGNLEAAEGDLAGRLQTDPANDEARFGLAIVRFAKAIEDFGRHHYRYGLDPARAVPFLRMPVPENPRPERLSYETQRGALRSLLDGLAEVKETLAPIRNAEVKIALDLNKVRFNFAPGAPGSEPTGLIQIIGSLVPTAPAPPPAEPGTAPGAQPLQATEPPFDVGFDRADALWLQGYCNLLSAGLEFILAHDWRDTFERGADLFYPHLRKLDSAPQQPGFLGDPTNAADAVAMLHEIRWQPIHPERLLKVRAHLKEVVALSRQSWRVILAETDDDHEWIPAPGQQSAAMPTMKIGPEQIKTWLSALDDFEAVLDGRKLIPHWRYNQGVNFRLMLEEPRPFDAVLWLTGHAAVPYLQDGPVLTAESWRAWEQVFGGNFLVFAVYLN
jgi:hypothetical protein